MLHRIDHLVFAVPNLASGQQFLEEKLGLPLTYGGQHPGRGTHNALLRLGPSQYLELLAPDPQQSAMATPPWMGIPLLTKPRLTRWAWRSENMEGDLAQLYPDGNDLPPVLDGARRQPNGQVLQWRLSQPPDTPEVSLLPFFIDWQGAHHPTDQLPIGGQLQAIRLTHPTADLIQNKLTQLGASFSVIPGSSPHFEALIACPKGLVWI